MFETAEHLNSHLTTLARAAWLHPGKELDLTRIFFPVVGVDTLQGSYDKYEIAPAMTPVDTRLHRDNSPRRIELDKTVGTWNCDPNALEIVTSKISLLQRGYAQRLRESKLNTLLSVQFASRQQATADAVSAAVTAETGLGAWGADADIIGEIDSLCRKVVQGASMKPNKLLIGIDAWSKLRNHPTIREYMAGNVLGLTPDGLRELLTYKGMEIILMDCNVVVDRQLVPLLNNDIFALYNEETPSLEDMSFGKEFSVTPTGPEIVSYEEKGVNMVDTVYWSSDCQIINPASCARLTVSTSA